MSLSDHPVPPERKERRVFRCPDLLYHIPRLRGFQPCTSPYPSIFGKRRHVLTTIELVNKVIIYIDEFTYKSPSKWLIKRFPLKELLSGLNPDQQSSTKKCRSMITSVWPRSLVSIKAYKALPGTFRTLGSWQKKRAINQWFVVSRRDKEKIIYGPNL